MRMSVCFLPFNIKETYVKNKNHYRFVTPINLMVCLNKKEAYDIICYLLSGSFNLNAFGYNKKINEFWGKKNNKEKCLLQFNLQINEVSINSSYIVITPTVGTVSEINKFICSFIKCISMYERGCM